MPSGPAGPSLAKESTHVHSVSHEVLDRIRAELVPWLREHAAETEQHRRLPDETAKRLRQSGVMRLLQPKRVGGFEADPQVFYESVRTIGTACGSSAWVTGVVGVHAYQVGLYDERAQDEVFGDDPDTWISSHYQPYGVLTPVDGGYRLSGHWHFSSGSDHCNWVFVGARIGADTSGDQVDLGNWYHVLVPRPDYRIEDVWDVVGLRGTGSNDIVVEDAFVPAHRVLAWMDLIEQDCPGRAVNTGPLFRMPWNAMFGSAVAAPMVGIGYGLLERYVRSQQPKPDAAGATRPVMGDWVILRAVAEAASDLDAARDQLIGNIAEMYEYAKADAPIPTELRQRCRRDQVMAGTRALRAADAIFEHAGGRALGARDALQRLWRDVHGARAHVVNSPNMALAAYATGLLGGTNYDLMAS
jgi:3-hydroxy-9,10-secoandrosta-1,3,5(10)-triene-9,17-dione monooxygenase